MKLKQKIVNWLIDDNKKIVENRNNHQFSEEERELSLERRRLNAELKRLEQKKRIEETKFELEQLKNELYGEEDTEIDNDNGLETQLLSLLAPLLMKKQTEQPTEQQQPVNMKIDLTTEQIKEVLNSIPKAVLKKIKKLDDETIKKLALSQNPYLSEKTLNEAVILVKQ